MPQEEYAEQRKAEALPVDGSGTSALVFENERPGTSSTPVRRRYQDSDNSDGRDFQQTVINMERGNIFTGTNYGHVTQQTIEEFQLLRNLPIHPDISGLSDYFPNSRADDEARILQWVNTSRPSELVLCVLGKKAASLLIGFALPDWTADSVVRMVAGQICGTYPELMRAISEAIRLDVGPSVTLETRIQTLILEPIRSLHLSGPLVVLLDALDQWAPHPLLANALSCLVAESQLIRFIILGRPGVEDGFQNVSIKRYDLLEVSKSTMRDYLHNHFQRVPWEYGRKPDAQTVDQLVDKANGLFIWSSIVCSLLEDQVICPKPHDTPTSILQSQHSIGDDDILANLYHNAINLRFPKAAHKAKLKVYLEAVLILQEPLPTSAFASLVSMEVASVRKIRADLGPLQTGQSMENQDIIHPASSRFHLSLSEYLQSSNTPSHLAFPIDTFISHSRLGLACLDEMRRLLSSPQSSFTSPLQKYAMRYWPIHIAHGTPSVAPTSDDAWKATPHPLILNSFSAHQWKHWATSYLEVVCPGTGEELSTEELTLPKALHSIGTKRPSARKTIWLFLGKIFHKPRQETSVISAHDTPRRSIFRVAQALYQSPSTEGTADAVAVVEVAVRLHHRSSDAWLELGKAYYNATKISASSHLIEYAVRSCRYAADLGGDEGRKAHQTLGVCLWLRFSRLGAQEDLDQAILLERAVLLLTPSGHPDRALSLNNLATSLYYHFIHTGAIESLDESIVLHREAMSLWPSGHPDRASSLNNLASSLYSHFERTGRIESLDEAIALHQEALSLRPPGHPDRAQSLNNLANCLYSHFEHTGAAESLDEAIVLHQEALSLRPPGHPDHAQSLNNLAASLNSHFEHTGAAKSLDEAIVLHREALSLRPPGHPDRS